MQNTASSVFLYNTLNYPGFTEKIQHPPGYAMHGGNGVKAWILPGFSEWKRYARFAFDLRNLCLKGVQNSHSGLAYLSKGAHRLCCTHSGNGCVLRYFSPSGADALTGESICGMAGPATFARWRRPDALDTVRITSCFRYGSAVNAVRSTIMSSIF